MKTCSKCNIEKDLVFFSRKKDKHQPWCKSCASAAKSLWAKSNKSKVKWNRLYSTYRIREADWLRFLNDQDGMCKLCKTKAPDHVDHDHNCCPGERSCGSCVRGLLCAYCNVMLAFVENNPSKVLQMQKYIQDHRK